MTVNNVSINSTSNIYATGASNTNASQQHSQATAGSTLNTMDALLESVGRNLGLSPAQIDAGQAIMHAAMGDYAGAAQNCRDAAENYLAQQSPIDRGYIENTQNNLADSGSQTALDTIRNANNTQQNTDEINGAKGNSKNFFELLAIALGKLMGEKMKKMKESLDAMESAGGTGQNQTPISGTTQGDASQGQSSSSGSVQGNSSQGQTSNSGSTQNGSSQVDPKTEEARKAEQFGIAQSRFSADAQIFSMVSNLVNTTLKTLGEALSTLARKG